MSEPLFEVLLLELGTPKPLRRFVPNVGRIASGLAGDVHLNVLAPRARAGGHFHRRVKEFFVNVGPGSLYLHLHDPMTGDRETVEMEPPSLARLSAYHVRLGVAHVVENPGPHIATLLIVVDADDPEDVVPAEVIPQQ